MPAIAFHRVSDRRIGIPDAVHLRGQIPKQLTGAVYPAHAAIPKDVQLSGAPANRWSLVKMVSWNAWETPHMHQIIPECSRKVQTNKNVRKYFLIDTLKTN